MRMETENMPGGPKMRPFFGRVMVMPSPVDEAQRESGLVIPMAYEGDDGIKRGVVAGIDDAFDEAYAEYSFHEIIPIGTVVYYTGGITIQGYVFLGGKEIIALEVEEKGESNDEDEDLLRPR